MELSYRNPIMQRELVGLLRVPFLPGPVGHFLTKVSLNSIPAILLEYDQAVLQGES